MSEHGEEPKKEEEAQSVEPSTQSSPASESEEVFEEAAEVEVDNTSLLPPSSSNGAITESGRSSTHSTTSVEGFEPDVSRQSSLTSAGDPEEMKHLSATSDLQDVALDTESILSRPVSINDHHLSRTLSKSPALASLNEGFEARSFDDRSPSLAAAQWRNSMPLSPALTQVEDESSATLKPYKRRTIASMSSISTGGGNDNFDFLIQRLDAKDQEAKESKQARRRSVAQLKEGFDRIQEELGATDEIDWDFWSAVISDYEAVAREKPKQLSRAIQRGIPSALRGMMWQLMSSSKDMELETTYSTLLKQTSPHEKAIMRDLSRTFPNHEYFKEGGEPGTGTGQENLFNVVKAYSLYDEDVGYCQGLQFIVGPLLLNMPDEEAFCVLVRLMKSYNLRSHYEPNMPGLQLRLFQFDRLVEEMVPAVFMHLLRQGVKSSMYASQWFLTLFGYRFPLELVASVMDLVFAEGVEAVFRFSVSLLRQNEAAILNLEFENLLGFLKNGMFEPWRATEEDAPTPYKAAEFVKDALAVKITPMLLDQFAGEWETMRKEQTAHATEVEGLRRVNAQLSLQVRGLESSLAQINEEHCDLVKQLVMAKLEKEEVEDELVKCKLALAEASHRKASEGATNTNGSGSTSPSIQRVTSPSISSGSNSFFGISKPTWGWRATEQPPPVTTPQ